MFHKIHKEDTKNTKKPTAISPISTLKISTLSIAFSLLSNLPPNNLLLKDNTSLYAQQWLFWGRGLQSYRFGDKQSFRQVKVKWYKEVLQAIFCQLPLSTHIYGDFRINNFYWKRISFSRTRWLCFLIWHRQSRYW